MHGSHFLSVACLVFSFSLLWPTLLACSSRASVTTSSLSFLEVFGLPTLFSLNYLSNWYQESSQVRWHARHAWYVLGTLSLFLLFSSSLHYFSTWLTLSIPASHDLTHRDESFWVPWAFWRCPLSGAIEACVTRLCPYTFSVGLNPQTSMALT